MHSSHGTKFQPERSLPDPVRARFAVFRPDSGLFSSHNCVVVREQEALWLLNRPNCAVVQQQQALCGYHTACVAATQPLCGCHPASVWFPHRGHAVREAREREGWEAREARAARAKV